ncbi:hypothetical protein [Corynebacterium spheniscorum]|uniref:Uncharacterized protein n=1 Tax=Corynebacterium spheniscorum TaxID=185761 RepID=A0A1I2PX46_9CORY|nr:hypothetical protein [Corynebacterium spheniscorum]KAA8723408.1 hypothetical protein F4V56_02910 [Corynebacterium spheniscorum]SFG18587.1 hypothetical protein SAMN05660282_00188 [Corynebacterium spheniscorum]
MLRTALFFILGVVIFALSFWIAGEHNIMAVVGGIGMGVGGGLIVWGIAHLLDDFSPTSRKLNR